MSSSSPLSLSSIGPSGFTTRSWRFAAASVSGEGHLARGIECQDAFHTNLSDRNNPIKLAVGAPAPVIIAIADGAGSSDYGAAGAALAAAVAHATVRSAIADLQWKSASHLGLRRLISDALEETRRQLMLVSKPNAARARPTQVRDFHTTLQVVLFLSPWLVTAQIGDGFVAVETARRTMRLICPPAGRGEHANETEFVNARLPSQPHVTVMHNDAVSGIAVSTDGLRDNLLEFNRSTHPTSPKASFFTPLFDEVGNGSFDSHRLMKLLRSPKMSDQTADDLTLVAMATARDL